MDMWVLIGLGLVFVLILIEIFLLFRRKRQFSRRQREFVISEWRTIVKKADSDPRHAIIEADKLLDYVLKKKGYKGALGEKLKKASGVFTNLDYVWEAHKLRNRIVHELGIEVSGQEARRVLSYYKAAFTDLGINVK